MINILKFKEFLKGNFLSSELYIDEFKPELQFAEIDCFADKPYKMAIEMSLTQIQISAISKKPRMDFSLYEYSFDSNEEAQKFIFDIKQLREYPFLPGADLSLIE